MGMKRKPKFNGGIDIELPVLEQKHLCAVYATSISTAGCAPFAPANDDTRGSE